jgi:hypothetical protein
VVLEQGDESVGNLIGLGAQGLPLVEDLSQRDPKVGQGRPGADEPAIDHTNVATVERFDQSKPGGPLHELDGEGLIGKERGELGRSERGGLRFAE